jgi:nucleoside-diphosphate-sugar epimerase
MKRILVTGGSGFVGRACLPLLSERGFEVHALCRRTPASVAGVTWHSSDLLQPNQSSSWLAEIAPTHLLHLAWCTEPGKFATSPQNMEWLDSSIRLFRDFQQCGGQRLVATGTCFEYQWSDNACHEDQTPTRPSTLYGQAKLAAADYLDVLTGLGLSASWARLFFIYGPGADERRIPGAVIKALHAGEVAKCTAGTQLRDFLHIDDVADALTKLVDSQITGPINICSGQSPSIREIATTAAELSGRLDLLHLGAIPQNPNDPRVIRGHAGRLQDELGWTPRYTLNEGLQQTIAAFQPLPCHKESTAATSQATDEKGVA